MCIFSNWYFLTLCIRVPQFTWSCTIMWSIIDSCSSKSIYMRISGEKWPNYCWLLSYFSSVNFTGHHASVWHNQREVLRQHQELDKEYRRGKCEGRGFLKFWLVEANFSFLFFFIILLRDLLCATLKDFPHSHPKTVCPLHPLSGFPHFGKPVD